MKFVIPVFFACLFFSSCRTGTDELAQKFSYLPVLTGRIVGSVTESERFLWDLRRAMADDIAHEYVGGLKTICNENNMQLWLENYGHWGFASEFLMYGGQSDLIGGEFWNEGSLGNIECKAASSAAHIYGKLILPDGMSYHLMVLPQLKTMRPEVLAKIEELVKKGGKILGAPPKHSPSLEGYPSCDATVREMAARLWAPDRDQKAYARQYGQGMVFDGMDLQQALQRLSLEKNVEMEEDIPVLWTHRTLPGKEIYFLTNQQKRKIRFAPSFRVSGLKPQLWDPVSGEIRRLNNFNTTDGRTTVPLQLNPLQSCFIVFSNQSGQHIAPGFENNFPEMKTLKTLHNKWQVEFHNKSIGPAHPLTMNSLKDWRFSKNPEVKYYSGGATYQTTFRLNELPEKGEVYLNLGNVKVMAEARLNGKKLGGVWIAPFRLNTNGYLQEGENTLKVKVVNLWRNRMIRDQSLPEAERYTWTYVDDVKAGEELQPSGLLGPVTLEYPE